MEKLEIGIETELDDLPRVELQISESSVKKKYPKKNKWTKTKVDECKRKINRLHITATAFTFYQKSGKIEE